MSICVKVLSTCVSHESWFIALKQQGQWFPSLEHSYLYPLGGLEDAWKIFPWSGVKTRNFPLFLITFSRCENIFIPPGQCQISQQLRSFKSTSLSPSTGQIHIPCQLYLRPNMKKITHISKPDIVSSSFCSRLAGNLLHMCNPGSSKYTTQQVGISTSSYYKCLHCFEVWVRPIYLFSFQVSVDVFVLGYKV